MALQVLNVQYYTVIYAPTKPMIDCNYTKIT